MKRVRAAVCLLLVVGLLSGCAVGPDTTDPSTPVGEDAVREPGVDGPVRDVRIDGTDLVLVTPDGERVLLGLDEHEGEPVHATLRPGGHDEDTVLLLSRVDDGDGARYELRYVVAEGEDVTDLYWFPWRLQVDEATAEVLDVPPLPVWAPDGSALAWVEWAEDGTSLRTVGWVDDGTARNPSDDADVYPLDEVPPGVQLEAWEQQPGGDPVMIGRLDDQPYRIEVALS